MTDDPITRRSAIVNSDLLTGIWNGLMIQTFVVLILCGIALAVLR